MSGSSGKSRQLAVVAAAMADDLRAAALTARALGFAALQLDVRLGNLDITQLSQSGRREVRSILRSRDLDLSGLRFDLGSKAAQSLPSYPLSPVRRGEGQGEGLGPRADIDASLDRVESVLEAAAGLQCPLVCIDLGPLPAPLPSEKTPSTISPEIAGDIIIPAARENKSEKSPRKFDTKFAASVDSALAELGRRADRHGVMIAFRSDLSSFAALDRALKTAACQWFGVDLDPVAILTDDWPTDEIFSRLGNAIRHVRARDALLGADRRTKPAIIGNGSVKWGQLLNNLESAGFNGWITLDPMELPNRKTAAANGVVALTQFIRE
ncbi:MAG TPA: TIM barrel protein [Tepidisphaeraceae bacterium]|jgi:sugar phosphate isomerase/epimerase